MNCPHCQTALETRLQGGITGAVCPRCEGVWVTVGALQSAIHIYAQERGVPLKHVALLEGPARTTTIHCPQCSSLLLAITLRAVEVEKCRSCAAVFLNRGEGEAIAQRAIVAVTQWEPAYQELLRLVRERLAAAPPRLDYY